MMQTISYRAIRVLLLCLAASSAAVGQSEKPSPHKIDSLSLGLVHSILSSAKDDVKKHYYDPTFHGVDIDARYKDYDARLASMPSLNEGLRTVAAFLEGLKDSHTFFNPPPRPYTFEPGYRMKIIGNRCFVTRVRPKTEAAEKLHPGDRIVKFNGFEINRGDFWDIGYYFNLLNPSPVYELDIESPDGTQSHVSIKAAIHQGKRTIDLTEPGSDYWDLVRRGESEDDLMRSVVTSVGDVAFWRMPEFNLSPEQVDSEFGKVRNKSALVLDLRGNPGGYSVTLQAMIGNLFDHEVKIADRVARKDTKPLLAKPRGSHPFTGKVVVLVDSQSASCSELFARAMQLEHRGIVLGDVTAGAVMESIHYDEESGADTKTFYGFSITNADLKMTDGKSLEKSGVTPDREMVPNARALAMGVDPILVQAAEAAGGKLTLDEAAKLFPDEWKPL